MRLKISEFITNDEQPEYVIKQDSQCAYNVTFTRVRATIVAVECTEYEHNLSVCICSLRHPAYNAHAPYCHLWPAPL